MRPLVYFFLAALLLAFAYVVFRRIVRRDYAARGRLGTLSSSLQLLVFVAFFGFPYLYNPPEWALFWLASSSSSQALYPAGLLVMCAGFVLAFGTMAWFGFGRALGTHGTGLKKAGLYRLSRNPQILGGYLLTIGTAIQRPSLYALGWVLCYGIIGHWMVITEEEHLLRVCGEEYAAYCSEVPRYLPLGRR